MNHIAIRIATMVTADRRALGVYLHASEIDVYFFCATLGCVGPVTPRLQTLFRRQRSAPSQVRPRTCRALRPAPHLHHPRARRTPRTARNASEVPETTGIRLDPTKPPKARHEQSLDDHAMEVQVFIDGHLSRMSFLTDLTPGTLRATSTALSIFAWDLTKPLS